jgi:hypothetical protein
LILLDLLLLLHNCFVIPLICGATLTLKISVNNISKAFNRYSIKDSCTGDIPHNKKSATIRNMKPQWWKEPVVQEKKYQGKGNL